jgi:nucleoside-diphosphate-sugar epimerase
MRSDYADPLNLGTDRLVSINELVDLVARIAKKTIFKTHDLSKPQGVRGRNSNNDRLRRVLSWEPSVTLEEGIAKTYSWIEAQLAQEGRLPARGAAAVGA